MANINPDLDGDEQPLDPAMERVRRKMIRLLAVSIGIMVIGLMAVLAAIVYKINQPVQEATAPVQSESPGQPLGAALEGEAITLDPGTRILSHNLSDNTLSLETRLANGTRQILVYDVATKRVVARIAEAAGN
ncbi:fimbrial protein [Phyllobacterium zundukense]|uniref:Fimbrial protein n=1 Tax=Phyllobacterium zundukense TaxID=1867719 RepID=A0A2N9W139_9HYPH|nr:fimbrial protein [Phyllobacterium zundukense]ATU90516.1 fimbrial protein [Phyllobacterium zundukense]PIO45457.1 fimbrial protein [Phyllobacterium zundukense]